MADRLAELRDQQAALDADLAEVRAQMKAAKQKRHSAARKAKNAWQLTEHVSTVALMVYILAGYAFAPAVKYLVGERPDPAEFNATCTWCWPRGVPVVITETNMIYSLKLPCMKDIISP